MKMVRYAVSALATSAAVLVPFVACEQPKPRCTITPLNFIAKYTPVGGALPQGCPDHEVFTTTPYFGKAGPATAKFTNAPDLDQITMVLKPALVGSQLGAADEVGGYDESKTYALGKFDTVIPGADNTCTIRQFAQNVDVTLPALPADGETPATPATTYQYAFSDFRIYVTAEAYGTVFQSKLSRTITAQGAPPVACQYDVYAIAPAVPCETDEDCSPVPDPDAGRFVGSGTSPDFENRCDTAIGYCFPPADAGFPPLKKR